MSGRFLLLFAATITLVVLAGSAGRSAFSGGGPTVAIAFVALAVAAVLGLAMLVRIAYQDGVATRRGREGRGAR